MSIPIVPQPSPQFGSCPIAGRCEQLAADTLIYGSRAHSGAAAQSPGSCLIGGCLMAWKGATESKPAVLPTERKGTYRPITNGH